MSGQNTALAFGGTAVAAAVGGPMATVFSELMLVLAIMGSAGGLTRAFALRLGWVDTARGALIGGLLAFGLGAVLPHILGPWLGADLPMTAPVLAGCAYLAGFLQDVLVARMLRGGRS